MNENQITEEDIRKYTPFVNTFLEKEEGLAAIVIRLKNKGVGDQNAKELVARIAEVHTYKTNQKAIVSLTLGIIGTLVLGIVGIASKNDFKYFMLAILSLFGGFYQYISSKKRLNYLLSFKNKN